MMAKHKDDKRVGFCALLLISVCVLLLDLWAYSSKVTLHDEGSLRLGSRRTGRKLEMFYRDRVSRNGDEGTNESLPSTFASGRKTTIKHTFPETIEDANGELIERRNRLVKSWVKRYKDEGLNENWEKHAKWALRKIGAGLYVFAYPHHFAYDDITSLSGAKGSDSIRTHKEAFQQVVRSYLKTASAKGRSLGTDGDYDFVLKEIIPILYLYKDRPDVLDKEMVWLLLSQGYQTDIPFTENQLDFRQIVKFRRRFKQPETENHVLMIYGWKYLIQNYVKWMAGLSTRHPRYDKRVTDIYKSNPSRYESGGDVSDFVLQILGRVVHSGLFETNAKPYESFSLSAIMNFYSFADKLFPNDTNCRRVKAAAQNALDYLAAKFAFQSLESKRVAPMRREWKHRRSVGFYEGDYVPKIFGALSGAYRFDDSKSSNPGQAEGFALWTMLLDYRIPDAIHDFMIHKYNGYWARMQSRYGDKNYDFSTGGLFTKASNRHATYFNSDGSIYMPGNFEPVTQFYFVTQDYMNIAGGRHRCYFDSKAETLLASLGGSLSRLKEYAAQSRPSTIITKHDEGDWGASIESMENNVMTMRGQNQYFWESKNLATYKSFAFGYDTESKHTHWPQRIPESWKSFNHVNFDIDRAHFKIFDFTGKNTNHPLAGYYVVVGQVSQKTNRGQHRNYARGFWEVVPGHQYSSAVKLKEHIIRKNPRHWYGNDWYKDGGNYMYVLASTGERVEVYDKYGSSADGACHTFLNIWDAKGNKIKISKYQVDYCNQSSLKNDIGLIDVWEVNKDYEFTGYKYAEGAGDGKVEIRNKYLPAGELKVEIDGRNYRDPLHNNPVRSGPKVISWQDRTYNKKSLDIACGPDGTVYTVGPEDYTRYGSFTYKLEGRKWVKVHGQAVHGAVDSKGDLWHVNREGMVWRTHEGSWVVAAPEGTAADIDVGADGSTFIAGMTGGIYKWINGTKWKEYRRLKVDASRVSVDRKGRPWAIGEDGSIWKWSYLRFSRRHRWVEARGYPKPAHDISIGDDDKIMVTAGELVKGQGYGIYVYRGWGNWENVGGHANEIALCGRSDVWTVRDDKTIFSANFSLSVI